MTTIAAGTSDTMTLTKGYVLNLSGIGNAIYGPGPQFGQVQHILYSGSIGPFNRDQVFYLTAATTRALDYTPALPLTGGGTTVTASISGGSTVGSVLTCTVASSFIGTPTYQWRKDGANISGATSSTFTTVAAGVHDCLVSGYVVTSSSITVSASGGGAVVNMFVFAGQSQANCNGTTGNDVVASVSGVMPTIYTWDMFNKVWVNYQAGTGGNSAIHTRTGSPYPSSVEFWGSEANFCKQWAIDRPGVPLYIVKSAFSSTSLDTRARTVGRGCWDPTLPADLYSYLRTWVQDAKAALVASGKSVNMRGMAWIQGENDADNATTSAAYQTNLGAFIDTVRTDFLGATAPFVISRIQTSGWTAPAPTRAAQVFVGENKANCRWVDADSISITPGNDPIHYDPAGNVDLGQRIYDAANTAADAVTAYVAKMTTPPSAPRQALLTTLFDSLISSSNWATLAQLQLYASHDAQSALVNAKNGTYTPTSANVTFTADRGYTGNGSTGYVNTGFNALAGDKRVGRTCSWSFYSPSDIDTANTDMGFVDGSAANLLQIRKTGNSGTFRNTNATVSAENTFAGVANAAGLWSMVRDGINSSKLYRNGSLLQTDVVNAAATFPASQTMAIANRNNSGSYTVGTTKTYALFAAGGPRTANQEAALNTALTTYLTALGAA